MADSSILQDQVRTALDGAGVAYEALECPPELADTAEFCAHFGIVPEDACNTILVVVKTTPRRYLACLVRGDMKLDVNRKVAAIAGTKKLSFASSDETAELTSMLIGGVTAPGLPPDIPIYVDERVLERPSVIIGGGNRSSKVRIAPSELVKLPNASVADIAIPR